MSPRPVTAAVVLLAATSTFAAEPLALADAMALARQQAREVTAVRFRQAAADERASQARGFRLPSVRLEENWIRTNSPAEVFALTLNQERFSLGDLMVGNPNDPDPLTTAITRLEVAMPLYTGGELGGRVRQAELAAESAASASEWAGNQAAYEAAAAYVMLSQADEYVRLLTQARETVAAHVALARAYEEQGMLVRSELLRAEVELARMDDLLSDARGRAKIAQANLAFRLGEEQGKERTLAALPDPSPIADGLDVWLASAAQRRDLTAARSLLQAGELEDKVKRAAFLPKIGVVARGDLVDDTLFGDNGDSWSVMAQASINLFAGGSDKAARAAARHELAAGREDVERFEQGVQLEVRQAYEEAMTARARHETARRALTAAREAERIVRERFATGVVKMIDLLDASTARREAETRELVARDEAHVALFRLAVKAGRAPETVIP